MKIYSNCGDRSCVNTGKFNSQASFTDVAKNAVGVAHGEAMSASMSRVGVARRRCPLLGKL